MIVTNLVPLDFSLCENDEQKSIMQNVSLLISTRKGTVPMYRNFGITMEFLDRPNSVAEALLTAEIAEGISEFEPRAKLVSVSVEGKTIKVEVKPNG